MPYLAQEQIPYEYEEQMPNGCIVKTDMFFLGKILKDMKAGFTPIINISGRQRSGKSYWALIIANYITQIFGKEFNLDNMCFYDPIELIKSLDKEEKHEVKILDETSVGAGRQEWYTAKSKALSKVILTQGYMNNLIILISPFLSDTTSAVTRNYDYSMLVKRRGHVKISKFIKYYDKIKAAESVRKIFMDDVFYKKSDLPTDIWEAYEKFSFQKKEEIRIKYTDTEGGKKLTKEEQAMKEFKTKWGLA